jgi:hypothetical protein
VDGAGSANSSRLMARWLYRSCYDMVIALLWPGQDVLESDLGLSE